jgi:hypothetical protein
MLPPQLLLQVVNVARSIGRGTPEIKTKTKTKTIKVLDIKLSENVIKVINFKFMTFFSVIPTNLIIK